VPMFHRDRFSIAAPSFGFKRASAAKQVDVALLFGLAATLSLSIKKHFLFRENHIGGSIGLRFSITDVFVIALLAALLIRARPDARFLIRLNGPITKAFLLYLAIAALSTTFGADVELGVFELIALVQAYLLFAFLTNYLSTRRLIRTFIAGSLFGLLLQCGATFIEVARPGYLHLASFGAVTEEEDLVVRGKTNLPHTDHGTTFIAGEVQERPSGLLIHPNALALYLAMLIPVAAGAWLSHSDWRFRLLSVVALAAGLGAIYFTLSRSGWVALLAAMVSASVIACNWRILRIGFREKLAIAFLAITLLGIAAAKAGKIISRLTDTASEAVDFRTQLSSTALRMLSEHPFLGVGLNSFDVVATEYDSSTISRIKVYPVHNCVLLEFSELGLFGGTSFVILLGAAFAAIYRSARRASSISGRLISIFTGCGVGGFFLGDLSNPLYRTPVLTSLVWAQFGLAIAAANNWQEQES
jgi:putative inorganic carbon (hco3(-)) transporter